MPQTRSIGEILLEAAAGDLKFVLAENRQPYDPIGAAERLFAMIEARGIECVLVGALAVLQYVEGRNTSDIDMILSPEGLSQLPELAVSFRDRDFARATFEDVQVDILFTANRVFDLVRQHHVQTLDIGGLKVPTATPQGLLILKLFALPSLYRQGDNVRAAVYEADILGLLGTGQVDAETAVEALDGHLLPADISELRRVLTGLGDRGSGFGAVSSALNQQPAPRHGHPGGR